MRTRGALSPRSRLLRLGPEALDDSELLEVVVRAGCAEARRLLSAAGGLRRLLGAKRERLNALGLPAGATASLLAFQELSCRALRPPSPTVRCSIAPRPWLTTSRLILSSTRK